MITLLLLLTVVIVAIYIYYCKVYKIRKFLEKFPRASRTDYSIEDLSSHVNTHGSTIHLKVAPMRDVLLTCDHDFLEFLLSSNSLITKSPQMQLLTDWMGDNLAIARGNKWKNTRRLLTPAFHFKILEQFVDVFETGGYRLVQELAEHDGTQSLDMHSILAKCTFTSFCETSMGLTLDPDDRIIDVYVHNVEEMLRIYTTRWISILGSYKLFFRFSKTYNRYKNLCEFFHNFSNDAMKARQKHLSAQETRTNSKQKRKVFLDLILDAKLPYKQMRDEVDGFMFAGHDTITAALKFTLYLLANHMEIQEKVHEEQKTLFGNDHNPKITYNDLQKMSYLDKVIKESMRIYPPVPIYGRLIDKDVVYNGTTIPKGVIVVIFVPGIHMNPKFFPDPDKFDPERFSSIDGAYPFAYVPFSAGPRNCIAQKYAILQLKSIISKIVRNFKLYPAEPKHELQLIADIVLKSTTGVKIGLKLRG